MKKEIHPKYNTQTKVSCACGNNFETGSTEDELKLDLCSACHPFYTGKQKLVDTGGRVDKFNAKIAKGKEAGDIRTKKVKRAVKAEKKVTKK